MDRTFTDYFDILLFPVRVASWVIAQPIKFVGWIVRISKVYDPEKVTCPACGFRGDDGTGKKSCYIRFAKVAASPYFMLRHTCLRCWADFYTKTYTDPSKWVPAEPKPEVKPE